MSAAIDKKSTAVVCDNEVVGGSESSAPNSPQSPCANSPEEEILDEEGSDLRMGDEQEAQDEDNDNSVEGSELGGTTVTTTTGSGANKKKEVLSMPMAPGSLPPRKRAKTKDEKEQRRIERIMRNRQAAHASREKKRKHLEELEQRCTILSSENDALKRQACDTKEGQMQMLEQQYLLMTRLQQLQSLVKTARATGDLSVLDSVENMAAAMTAAVTHGKNTTGNGVVTGSISPASTTTSSGMDGDEGCASPESLVLGGLDSISSSPSASGPHQGANEHMGSVNIKTEQSTGTCSSSATSGSASTSSTSTTTTTTTSCTKTKKTTKQENDECDFGFGTVPSSSTSLFSADSPSYSLKTESDSDSEMYMFEPGLNTDEADDDYSNSLSLFARAHHPAAVMPSPFDQQRRRNKAMNRMNCRSRWDMAGSISRTTMMDLAGCTGILVR